MWILFWDKRSVTREFSDIKGFLNCLHVAFYPRINIVSKGDDDEDEELSWGTINILAWRDLFNNRLENAKPRVTFHFIIGEVEEMARQDVEES
jgi:hypothetical protein